MPKKKQISSLTQEEKVILLKNLKIIKPKESQTISSKINSSLSFLRKVKPDWRLQTISEVLYEASEYLGKFKFIICPDQIYNATRYLVYIWCYDWKYDFSYGFGKSKYLFVFTLDNGVKFLFGEKDVSAKSKDQIINALCNFFNDKETQKILKSYIQISRSDYGDSIL